MKVSTSNQQLESSQCREFKVGMYSYFFVLFAKDIFLIVNIQITSKGTIMEIRSA